MKTGKKKQPNTGKARTFFLVYFSVITLILLWNLFHCTEVSWITADAAAAVLSEESKEEKDSAEGGVWELKDDTPLTVQAQADPGKTFGHKPRLRGAALLGYENSRSLMFSDETVTAEVFNLETKEKVGQGTLWLKNQTPYPNDETMVYIAFSETVEGLAPEQLEVRFSTSGLTRNGIFLYGEKGASEEGRGTAARLFYEKKSWNPIMSILYFLVEFAAGLGCLLLYGERLLPLLLRSGKGPKPDQDRYRADHIVDPTDKGRKPGVPQIKKLGIPVLVIALCLGVMLYTYIRTVRRTEKSSAADLLTGGTRADQVLTLAPGTTARQMLTAGEDEFSGIGILLSDEEGKKIAPGEETDYSGTVLEWKLFDESGTAELTSGSGTVGDLKKVSSVLETDIKDEKILASAEESAMLSFERPVASSIGKKYVLELSVPLKGGKQSTVFLLAAGDTNGQIEINGRDDKSSTQTTEEVTEAATEEIAGETTEEITGTAAEEEQEHPDIDSAERQSLPLELGLMGIYKCNSFIKGMFLRLCAVLILMLTGLYFAAQYFSRADIRPGRQTAAMYLVSALCMGMVFSFMTPAYTISDERTHVDAVYILSNRLLGVRDIPGPSRLLKRACDIDSSIAITMPLTAERYRSVERELFGAASKMNYGTVDTEGSGGHNAAESASGDPASLSGRHRPSGRERLAAYTRNSLDNVPVLCYLPASVGFTAARLMGRNLITMVMAARWLNLLACILVMYMAVRRMPYAGAMMAVIGLFPKTLQQMASCSYDGMVIAGIFLFTAYCLAVAFDKEICIADLLVLTLSGIFAASCKGGAYLPVLGMLFLIPAARSGMTVRQKFGLRWYLVCAAAAGSAVFLFAGKYVIRLAGMFGRKSGSAVVGAGAKSLYTVSDFIHAPGKLVHIYLNTLYVRSDGILGELVGKNLSQKWYIVYAFLILAILGLLRRFTAPQKDGMDPDSEKTNESSTGNHICLSGRIWILLLAAASTALIFLSMLIAFTSREMPYIDGLQGRYFLPIAPLPFLAAENGLVHRNGIDDTTLLYTADVLLALTFCEMLMFYLGPL